MLQLIVIARQLLHLIIRWCQIGVGTLPQVQNRVPITIWLTILRLNLMNSLVIIQCLGGQAPYPHNRIHTPYIALTLALLDNNPALPITCLYINRPECKFRREEVDRSAHCRHHIQATVCTCLPTDLYTCQPICISIQINVDTRLIYI